MEERTMETEKTLTCKVGIFFFFFFFFFFCSPSVFFKMQISDGRFFSFSLCVIISELGKRKKKKCLSHTTPFCIIQPRRGRMPFRDSFYFLAFASDLFFFFPPTSFLFVSCRRSREKKKKKKKEKERNIFLLEQYLQVIFFCKSSTSSPATSFLVHNRQYKAIPLYR